jgi:IS30 family transposase
MGEYYTQLSAEERGVIMAMVAQGAGGRQIARVLNRASSTVARELRRNGFRPAGMPPPMGRPRRVEGYDATHAGQRARRLRRKPRVPRKLHRTSALWRRVRRLLERRWSPQQVAAKLRDLYPHRPALRVSHETIYTAIYAMPRGQLRREVIALLRRGRSRRGRKPAGTDARGHLPDLPSIHLRPPQANERLLPGHWEGDLIIGAHNRSAVGVLVCRHSLFLMLAKVEDTTSLGVLEGFRRTFTPLPDELRQTLTYDQGKEMARHAELTAHTGLAIYFADPHSPWQRGICENTNGLLRQYLPKGTDLSVHSQRQLDAIAWEMNTRPRKTLNWRSPAEVFFEHYIKARDGLAPADALGG